MNSPFAGLAVPAVVELKPYVPGKPIEELERELGIRNSIKLASNENPLGCSPLAREAAVAAIANVARYPDGGGFALRSTLARHHGVEPFRITLGNGSNDVLDIIARVFLGPGSETVISQHAFAVYPISSQAVGATLRFAPARGFGHDLQAMRGLIGERTRVVWIANPNNPTGTWLSADELEAFLADLPPHVIAVVDEAYIEYAEQPGFPDASRWLDRFDNLIVTRTFSKAYGLAGLRIGYAISHPQVADLLNRVRQPFNVNLPAQAAAVAALQDQEFIRQSVFANRIGMQQLMAGIEALGLSYIPSVGNFLTIDLGRPAAPVDKALQREGVITRPIANYGLPDHLRVSIGTQQEIDRFLASLARVLPQC